MINAAHLLWIIPLTSFVVVFAFAIIYSSDKGDDDD